MKRLFKLVLIIGIALSLAACSGTDAPGGDTDAGETYSVAYLVNGNLGDKSFFDSAYEGLKTLEDAGRITLRTIEMGGEDKDKPVWLSTLYEVSDSEEYDFIVVGTFQMPDFLKEVATEYPDQKYIMFDDNTHVGANDNVVNLMYKQNELGYVVGVLAGAVTTEDSIDKMNADATVGFVGGVDSPVINDFLIGYIEGAKFSNEDIKIDIRYTNDYVDTAIAKEYALSMMNDHNVDVIWGVAGNAGNGAAEAILDNDKAWFIGVDSDQESTFEAELSAITLTSGLKNVGNSIVWLFDELDAGNEYWGTEVSLGLSDGGVGLVTDKNFDKILPDSVKDAVEAAIEGVKSGEIKVSSAFGADAVDIVAERDAVRP